jgi:hypothetical protein
VRIRKSKVPKEVVGIRDLSYGAEAESPPPMIIQARDLIASALEQTTFNHIKAAEDLMLARQLLNAIIDRYPELTAKQGERR